MPGELTLSVGTLYGFLLVLARVAGVIAFVPLPGFSGAPAPARAALALAFTLALSSQWPEIDAPQMTAAALVAWALAESAAGLVIGLMVALVLESFILAAQVLGLQAGYAYASTVDPNTQADSGVLLVFAQLIAGLLFFAMGLDREVLRLLAQSLGKIPPGAWVLRPASAEPLIRLGSELFATGVRLALPVVALLVMVDVALALVGRLNAQLQLLSLAFPAKMLTALLVLSWLASLFPRVLGGFSAHGWTAARRVLGL